MRARGIALALAKGMEARRNPALCSRVAALMSAIGAILRDDRKRREWLWLRAHEKNDEATIEALERADPRLPARLAVTVLGVEAMGDPHDRRAAYGRILDESLPWLDDTPCACNACAPAG